MYANNIFHYIVKSLSCVSIYWKMGFVNCYGVEMSKCCCFPQFYSTVQIVLSVSVKLLIKTFLVDHYHNGYPE